MFSPDVYWAPTTPPKRLAFGPRPRGGDWLADEIAGYRSLGFSNVVSLLERQEIVELALTDAPALCAQAGLKFHNFPIVDRSVPASMASARTFVDALAECFLRGEGIYVHCRAGIGRSATISAALMLRLGNKNPDDIFERLGTARGFPVPDTEAQTLWLYEFASTLTTSIDA